MDYDVTYDHVFKLIVIGDSAIGKSSLLDRYISDTYTSTYSSTIGVDFRLKGVDRDSIKIKLQIWDTAGQERFRAIVSSYYRGAHGVLLCFGYDSASSFNNLNTWLEEIDTYCQKDTPVLLIGTKNDYKGTNHQEVDDDMVLGFCDKHDFEFCSTSAKSNDNCPKVFDTMVDLLMLHHNKISRQTSGTVNTHLEKAIRKKKCC
jgi:Ras-related protein Rab-1A